MRGSQRFPKSCRLRKRREFLAVQTRGRKVHLRDLLVFAHGQGGPGRLGVTVSRKVGNAVQRNRVKRLLRELWRRHGPLFPKGYDWVFIAKRSARDVTYASLYRQLGELSRKLRPHGTPKRAPNGTQD